jgi:decaprenyl-phosphate phosphoribosyltransferase
MKAYIKIARFDHWFKNIFVIPGFVFALALIPQQNILNTYLWIKLLTGLIAIGFIASANYTINEYLDSDFDKYHPVKKNRPGVKGQLSFGLVILQYILFALFGLIISYFINIYFLYYNSALLGMGIIYNVKPIRSKDIVFLDVLSESINNPIRMLLGWSIVTSTYFPPSSILVSYWFGGAFLMAIKRYSEYRSIEDKYQAGKYRKSFKYYNENNLLISSFFYALNSVFFLGIFLIKYRIEYVLAFPLISGLFSFYLFLGMLDKSIVQTPEKLFKSKPFLAYVILFVVIMILLLFYDMELLNNLIEPLKY